MERGESIEGLVVATPERVAFEYEISGIGSRFLAQILDFLILLAILVALGIVAVVVAQGAGQGTTALLFFIISSFVAFFGYFPAFEWVWSGQTPGKRALRLRVVGDRGEPVTFTQVAIRNLVRLVDFLPLYYGIGVVALFAQGRGKRLGDMAAGTVVVRDRGKVGLRQLVAALPVDTAETSFAPRASIWADEAPEIPAAAAVAAAARPAPDHRAGMPRLDPALRQFVILYAGRRATMDVARRQLLAEQAAPALRAALPEQVASKGLLAVLDELADLV